MVAQPTCCVPSVSLDVDEMAPGGERSVHEAAELLHTLARRRPLTSDQPACCPPRPPNTLEFVAPSAVMYVTVH